MSATPPRDGLKDDLHRYLRVTRDSVLWKLEGLDDYSARRPMTPTATSVAGVVKHLAGVEAGYFGDAFGRPFPEPMPWLEELDTDPHSDLWVRAEESCAQVAALYRRVIAHADATIDALPLDAPGTVPWWSEDRRSTTLGLVLVHMVTETARHAGHLDILRETLDGATGYRADRDNMADTDTIGWAEHRARVERSARAGARDGSGPPAEA